MRALDVKEHRTRVVVLVVGNALVSREHAVQSHRHQVVAAGDQLAVAEDTDGAGRSGHQRGDARLPLRYFDEHAVAPDLGALLHAQARLEDPLDQGLRTAAALHHHVVEEIPDAGALRRTDETDGHVVEVPRDVLPALRLVRRELLGLLVGNVRSERAVDLIGRQRALPVGLSGDQRHGAQSDLDLDDVEDAMVDAAFEQRLRHPARQRQDVGEGRADALAERRGAAKTAGHLELRRADPASQLELLEDRLDESGHGRRSDDDDVLTLRGTAECLRFRHMRQSQHDRGHDQTTQHPKPLPAPYAYHPLRTVSRSCDRVQCRTGQGALAARSSAALVMSATA